MQGGLAGRAGRRGEAVTFGVEEDAPRLQTIADCMRKAGCTVSRNGEQEH